MQRLIDAHIDGTLAVRCAMQAEKFGWVRLTRSRPEIRSTFAELFANTTSPSLAARRGEIMTLVREALDQLDPIDREVLVLRHFEQMSNLEAAASLSIKPAAASKRYVRAVDRLRGVLEQFPEFLRGET